MSIEQCNRAHSVIEEGFSPSDTTWDSIIRTLNIVYNESDEEVPENIGNIVRCFLKIYVDEAFKNKNVSREKGVTLNGLLNDQELQELSEEESILLDTWVKEFLE